MLKRLIACLLTLCLFLSGCSVMGERTKEPVTFYYVCKNYQKDMSQVIGAEIREAAGHREDLPYLLALYSIGSSDEDLISPLPRNTILKLTAHTEDSIELELSESALTLTEAEFTLASACIAKTCMELIDVQQITVTCEGRLISIRKDNLVLYSDILKNPQEEQK